MAYRLNIERVQQRARKVKEQMEKRRWGFWQFPQGRTVIRLCPPWSEKAAQAGLVTMTVYKHWAIGPPGDENTYTCGQGTYPSRYENCPICQVLKEIGEFADPDRHAARPRSYASVIVRHTEQEGEVKLKKILQGPAQFGDWVLTQVAEPNVGDITDPARGHDIVVNRKGQQLKTRYDFVLALKETPLLPVKAEVDQVLKELPNLSKMFLLSDQNIQEQAEAAQAMLRRYKRSRGVAVGSVGDDEGTGEESEVETPALAEDEALEDEVRPPEIDRKTGRPVCFAKWVKRNPQGLKTGKTVDPQCQVCPTEITCRATARKKIQAG